MGGSFDGLYARACQAAAPLNLPLEPAELATLASDRDMGASELEALEATFAYLAEKKRLASIETLLRLSRLPRREPKTFDNLDFSRIQGVFDSLEVAGLSVGKFRA